MKKVSVKDFVIGALAAMLFMMLLGAGPSNDKVGRYAVAVGGGGGGYSACVTDSLTGDTVCSSEIGTYMERGGRDWSFSPDFSKK